MVKTSAATPCIQSADAVKSFPVEKLEEQKAMASPQSAGKARAPMPDVSVEQPTAEPRSARGARARMSDSATHQSARADVERSDSQQPPRSQSARGARPPQPIDPSLIPTHKESVHASGMKKTCRPPVTRSRQFTASEVNSLMVEGRQVRPE